MRESQERLERWLLLPESQEQAGERELELPRRILLQEKSQKKTHCAVFRAESVAERLLGRSQKYLTQARG